jgi:thioesterase domain-containing protein
VENERFTEATQLLVSMNEGDRTTLPLFLVPGVCGLAVDYVHLANSLDPSIPVFGAQIDEIGPHSESALHEYALRLIPEIQRTQENGPYAVAGYSAGAVIALEVAQILIDRGHQVDFMGIIDGVPPQSVVRRSPFTNPNRFLRFVVAIAKKAKAQQADASSGLGWLAQRLKPSIVWSYFAWTRPARKPQDVSELLHLQQGQIADHLVAKWQRTLDAVHAYRHDGLPADMTLFRTAADPIAGPHEADLGWGRVGSRKVFIEPLPGIHTEILSAKTAPILARLMEPHLLKRRRPVGHKDSFDSRFLSNSGTSNHLQ